MRQDAPRIRAGLAGILLAGLVPAAAAAQTATVPLARDAWIATDSIRFVSYLGRPSLYINRGRSSSHGWWRRAARAWVSGPAPSAAAGRAA